jgi:hypothetical protein
VERNKGKNPESEHVHALFRSRVDLARRSALSDEAAIFFADAPTDRKERRVFQSAGIASWSTK